MYDARNEAREFVGATRDEAVSKACAFFGVDEGGLRIVAPAPGEVYGLAARAVVVAAPVGAPMPTRGPGGGEREAREGGREGGRERGRGRDRERGREERGGRERGGRGRGERGDRERGERDRGDRDRGDRDRGDRGERAARAETFEDVGESIGTARGTLGEAGAFVKGLLERLEVGPFEIQEGEDGELVVVQLRGHAAQRVAGGDGRTLDAIQFLTNQAALRKDEGARRIVIDAEGDPERREAHLARLAERAAQRAEETGRAVALDPMNGRDRRVIHVALRDAEGIATMSIGEGRYRQVVVVPEGAPEYEEARRAAETASQGNG